MRCGAICELKVEKVVHSGAIITHASAPPPTQSSSSLPAPIASDLLSTISRALLSHLVACGAIFPPLATPTTHSTGAATPHPSSTDQFPGTRLYCGQICFCLGEKVRIEPSWPAIANAASPRASLAPSVAGIALHLPPPVPDKHTPTHTAQALFPPFDFAPSVALISPKVCEFRL